MKTLKRYRKKGFTFMELILSLSIFTILTIISYHSINYFFYNEISLKSQIDNKCFSYKNNHLEVYTKGDGDLICDISSREKLLDIEKKYISPNLVDNEIYVEYGGFFYNVNSGKWIN